MTDAADEIDDSSSGSEQNMSAIAFEKIRGMIVAGEIGGGSVVQERRLAAALGLSRTPVREALGRLSGEGYVRREGRVLTVNPILVEDVMEILTVRRAIESEAAEIAAGRFDPVKLCAIRAAVNGMVSPAEVTSERHWSVDDLVHLSIAEAAGNRLIVRLVTDLRQRTRMFGLTRIPRRFEPGKREHLAILDAIEAGDGAAAKAAMRLHIDSARKGILNSLAGEGGRDWHGNG